MASFSDNFNRATDIRLPIRNRTSIQNIQGIGGKPIFINQTVGKPIRITNV